MKYMLEVGARTIDDVLAAERGGAERVELYSSPLEGALTPSAGLIKNASEAVNHLQLFVMIRPRAGDFLYSDNEFKTMQRDVEIAVEMGADGIMCGILKSNGKLDIERMKDLKKRSGEKKFTLHRAFDFSKDPMRTLDEAISLGCDYILTLGQELDATFSREKLFEIMRKAECKTKIVLGLGADFDTASELDSVIKETGACEYHIVNGYRKRPSKMEETHEKMDNDDYLKGTMYSIDYLSEKAVRECRNILDKYEN